MKNKTLVLGLIWAITIPQVATAAWWNPLTWFNQEAAVFKYDSEVPVTAPEVEPEVVEIQVEKVVEKPVEKIVEKVIKVDNPELQSKIDSLIKENEELKSKLSSPASLTQLLNVCKAELVEAKSKLSQNTNSQNPTSPIAIIIDGAYCTAKEPAVAKLPISISGGWWEYGEIVLSKNLASPNSWSSEDTVTTMVISPGIKELRLSNRDGSYPIKINLYSERPLNGQVKQESFVSGFTKTVFIPKGLPCQ
jgi:hypothetical protein